MENINTTQNEIEFTNVDIEEFYDKDELNKDEFSTNLVVLTEKEQILVNTLFDRLFLPKVLKFLLIELLT